MIGALGQKLDLHSHWVAGWERVGPGFMNDRGMARAVP